MKLRNSTHCADAYHFRTLPLGTATSWHNAPLYYVAIDDLWRVWFPKHSLRVVRQMLLQDLSYAIDDWIAYPGSSFRLVESIVVMFSLLRCIPLGPYDEETYREAVTEWQDVLVVLFEKLAPIELAIRLGLVSMVLESLSSIGTVSVNWDQQVVTSKSS